MFPFLARCLLNSTNYIFININEYKTNNTKILIYIILLLYQIIADGASYIFKYKPTNKISNKSTNDILINNLNTN